MVDTARVERTADVDSRAVLGPGTTVWHLAQVRENARLGRGCIVGRGAYVGPGVLIGDNVKLQNYALVYEPARLEDSVFIGPAAVLTNDLYPRSVDLGGKLKRSADWDASGVVVREGASLGARVVVVPGRVIGRWAMVAAGAVVTRDVPDFALVAGVPARRVGWVGRAGERLVLVETGQWRCPRTGEFYEEGDGVLSLAAADGAGARERCSRRFRRPRMLENLREFYLQMPSGGAGWESISRQDSDRAGRLVRSRNEAGQRTVLGGRSPVGGVMRNTASIAHARSATSRRPQLWHRRRTLRRVAVLAVVLLAGGLLAAAHAAPAHAACANPIACENQLPGTPQSVWDVSNYSTTIQGFADPFSVNIGNSINFKIESPASSYKIDIYRMGYYGGDGARLITSLTPNISVSQSQPSCNTNTVTGLVDCGNWGVSATWNVPSTAVSGVYFARIYRTDGTSGANQIPFVVTDNSSHSDILFMTSDETWQAYNDWGGYSLYTGNATGSPWCCSALDPGRAVQVSYNRPFATRYDSISPNGQDFFFYAEFPMIEFLEKNGYDVSYVSQIDVAQPGAASMIEQHKALINVGHSEYWDAGGMANITAARNAGVNLAFFTGNTAWWKTRWANSQYGNEPYRTLITYKESLDSTQSDPADPPTWTGAWRDPRFSPPGRRVAGERADRPALGGQLLFLRGYGAVRLRQAAIVAKYGCGRPATGQTYTMPDETLGYEWDSDVDNGFRPAGEIDMSQTCAKVQQKLYALANEELVSDNACNSLTLYRAASGALVFDAGTVQWAWGLESDHDGDAQNPPDPAMQQATVNLFADMGVQPATLESDLTPATASTDHTPPTSTITSPSAGATFTNGSTVTITGTATDSGGGVVAGVEVSTDGGSTWHPVTTMSAAATSVNWSYTWSAAGSGPVTIESRATDDSGNTETPGPGVSVTVNCPCSLFGANYTPYITSDTDSGSYELGMKFQSTVPGWVAGVRFYKGAGNDGTHTGSLWTSSGTLLATGTFTNETASGWQTLTFANPVQISANTTYVVSYYDPDGHYSVDEEYFASQVNTPPLIGVKANYLTAGGGNGVFNPGGPGFPTQMNDSWSYSVDVIFDTTQPPSHPDGDQCHARCWLIQQSGLNRPHGDVLRGSGAQHGVVHGHGPEREHGLRHDLVRRHRHGGYLHPGELAGARYHLYRHDQRGQGQQRRDHADAVHVYVHHQQGVRRRGQVPVRHLA